MDSVTRTREPQKLLMELLERKILLRARQLYLERKRAEGQEGEEGARAESEILKSGPLTALWKSCLDLKLVEATDPATNDVTPANGE